MSIDTIVVDLTNPTVIINGTNPTYTQSELGSQGVAGPTGQTGAQGPTGAVGAQGAVGSQGAVGAQGSQGAVGATGLTGPAVPLGSATPVVNTTPAVVGIATNASREDHAHPIDTTRAGVAVANTFTKAQIINPDTDEVSLILKGIAGQTADLLQVKDSSGTTIASINSFGNVNGKYISASLQASVISFTPGTVLAYFRGAASQTANLMEWQNSAGTVLSAITAGGVAQLQAVQVTSATVPSNGIYLAAANTLGFSTNGGLTLRIFPDGGATANGTGTWTINQTWVNARSDSLALKVVGFAGQTANLQQWQDSSGTVLAAVSNAGDFAGKRFAAVQTNAGQSVFDVVGAAAQTADLQQWRNSSGTVLAFVTAGGGLGISSNSYFTSRLTVGNAGVMSNGIFSVKPVTSSQVVSFIQGVASQTADLTQWANSSLTVLAKVDAAGNFGVGAGATALTYGLDIFTGSARIWNGITGAGQSGTLFLGDGSFTKAFGSSWSFAGGMSITGGYGATINGQLDVGGSLGYGAQFNIQSAVTTRVSAIFRGIAAQTADLLQLQASGGGVLSLFDASGRLVVGRANSMASASLTSQNARAFAHYDTNNTVDALAFAAIFYRGNSAGNAMGIAQKGDGANGIKSIVFTDTSNNEVLGITQAGLLSYLGTNTSATANAGTNGAAPAQVAGYLKIDSGGTIYKVPYFLN